MLGCCLGALLDGPNFWHPKQVVCHAEGFLLPRDPCSVSRSRDPPFRGTQTEGKKGCWACGKSYLVPKFRRDLYLQLYHAVPLGQELPSNYCQLLCIHGTSSSSSKLIWTLSGLVPRNPPSSFSFPAPKGSTLT